MKLSIGSIHTRDNQIQKSLPTIAEEFNSFVVQVRHFPRPRPIRAGVLLELARHKPVAEKVFDICLATFDEDLAVGYVSRIINNARSEIKLCKFEIRSKI